MAWFKRKEPKIDKKVKIPEGLWVKCENCKEIIYRKELENNLKVCPKCQYHFRISAKERISLITDTGSFTELDSDIRSPDPLEFKDTMPYKDRLQENEKKTGLKEAAIYGDAKINGRDVVIAVLDFSFMGGSMGTVVGEKVTRAAERAVERQLPLIIISSSGGARMQEGMFSLMQMAKTSQAIGRVKEAGLLYISVLADPTFGGVTASFAMLGDIIIAEPKSLIGFAGPRVIQETIKQQLPEGFQRAEFLLEHGMVDIIVERKELKNTIHRLIEILMPVSTSYNSNSQNLKNIHDPESSFNVIQENKNTEQHTGKNSSSSNSDSK
ncbi:MULTISPECIES: acetyl-CoA carboxylase, carboxyltransferase subunit beta [Thermodesulfovibrio]|jgi:acetyl-CoA carboxylase carboxyl transferase subunit beta|uniref:Acetyl-coenzyme A carboxylase carboxyl transferase subunit beta n=1 Tax=Thermodesulfovibrio yellowstonii TaxID=28262 RepID=A0A9W6GHP3_9BACT|nr:MULTISPECIES: acetyl-CoA carboxylase, carboxyltransferase subunit beta [Thermodesulfovibrio]MDI6864345.1 acetyl-CoA carboxylase, carboxyltransferase subunit beta [Thermodesulfovibrio yellowstonii]GLI54071.1 acetyl-coenzyme A carboxylase carboxyl transferase subunit beta [Thermodesulfovibrio islandicus]